MRKSQIEQLAYHRDFVKRQREQYESACDQLRALEDKCDHKHANGHSAVKTVSTHDPKTCDGYKECAVCAGEQKETFIDVCQICKRRVV